MGMSIKKNGIMDFNLDNNFKPFTPKEKQYKMVLHLVFFWDISTNVLPV